ncbi:hypothetical protein [Microvirga sp. M2]|uniref:hypothetical protein n=1 Tax=Microvirga sp. M2 TaxID=3073270 RepID=UPI0039C290FF
MFSTRDFVTAGINVLGAIDALEGALARATSGADSICVTEHEKDLICMGIVDARFVLSTHGLQADKVLTLLTIRLASSLEVSRTKALSALSELRTVEALAAVDAKANLQAIAA